MGSLDAAARATLHGDRARSARATGARTRRRATTRSARWPTACATCWSGSATTRATIAGHSLGGGIAMQFAYQYPERCERLVLVASGGLGRSVNGLLRAAALPGAGLVLSVAAPPIVAVGGLLWIARRPGRSAPGAGCPGGLEGVRDARRRPDAVGLPRHAAIGRLAVRPAGRRDEQALPRRRDARADRLGRARPDHSRPITAGGPTSLIPNSTYVEFEDSGHMPHADEPARFAEAVLDFAAA